jgi:signal transduction histidine kinase
VNLSVRVIAPTGRDSELITAVLKKHGVSAQAGTVAALLAGSADDALLGPILIAEEALNPSVIEALASFLRVQPSWSDLPILILTGSGRETLRTSQLQAERLPLGSPVLLERPIRTATLVSSVQAALRARARQYEIRTAVAQLREERALLEAMLDNLPVGVVLAKASGEIVRGNRRLDEITRHPLIPSPDFNSHAEWKAFHRDGRKVSGEEYPLPRAIRSGHAQPPEEYLYERGDGTRAWVSIAASPILNEAGEVTGGVVALSDIDLQKRSELALIQNEKLAAVGRLAASISHEINNPLEAVTNLIYLSRHSENLPSDVRGYLASADQELSRVSQIVSHTLRFHRQSTNPTSLLPQDLLAPTVGLFAGRMANAQIELDLRHRHGDLITCYEGEIRQVLNNLVGNAIDSMRNGGRLVIRTQRSRLWKQDVSGVRITIADTGCGVSRDVVKHIFDAFFTTKGINGTGLGLWISKGIIEKHSGDLRVRSRADIPKTGTVFSLFLPYSPF